ncbi:sensor histidine kinase [Actinoplanes sichuanensis]|uniref:sensor histidine kinase n=2 Tax=Actinoplanes sichuanensis TaxID=512349 RepID=UPI0029556BD6|nr:sensor histidine kinase [Actinoplanes sichuanensis]
MLFGAMVITTIGRLAVVSSELCWEVAPPIVLLTVSYGIGLACWERLRPAIRHAWLTALLILWCWACWILPAHLAAGYAWLVVPLAVLALRMFGEYRAVAVVALITAALVVCLVRVGSGLRLDLLAPPVAAVWTTVGLYRMQQRLVGELRAAHGEPARQQREAGRLAERARIARDLHDAVAQELAGNRMLLQAADRDWDRRPEAARRQVRVVSEALGASLAETRSIIDDLTPPTLERAGLVAAVRELCSRNHDGAPQIVFATRGEPGEPATDRATALLRVVQGLLANAVEHAGATNIWITLDHRREVITVEVRDDGVGFDSVAASAAGRGFGLAAVRERLAAFGGGCVVHSALGQGTRVLATLPTGA